MSEIKKQFVDLAIATVEEETVIVNINGWRKRVQLELSDADKAKVKKGRIIAIEYVGNLEDVHTLKFLPLKTI